MLPVVAPATLTWEKAFGWFRRQGFWRPQRARELRGLEDPVDTDLARVWVEQEPGQWPNTHRYCRQ